MEDGPRLRCHVLDTGHCLASERHLITGGRNRTVACHSIVALLGHPRQGWFLWDAGYAPRLWRGERGPALPLVRWGAPPPPRAPPARAPPVARSPPSGVRLPRARMDA